MKAFTQLRSTYVRLLSLSSKTAVKYKWASNCERKFATAVTASGLIKDGIISSPYKQLSIPVTSLPHYMLQKIRSHGDLIALVNGVTGEEMTYKQLHAKVIKVASAFVRNGLRKGDVVTVLSPNCVEYAVLYLGALAAGGIVSTLNPQYTAYELEHALQESHSKWLVCAEALTPVAQQARKSCPDLKEVIVFGSADGCRPFTSLLADDGGAFPDNLDFNVKDDLAVLPFSSGTTGLPKGVMLTHYNLVSNIEQMCTDECLGIIAGVDVYIAILPFFHIYGQVVTLLTGLSGGGKVISVPKFDAELYLRVLQTHRATFLHVVPPVVLFFAKHPLVAKCDFSSVHTIFTGAAPVGAQVIEEAIGKIKVDRFRQGYGLTEASPVTHVNPTKNYKFNTIGPAVHNTEFKIVDISTGAILPEGKEGEVCIRGPQVMKGYFNNPSATAHTVRDGWLHTGDVGYFDSDGHAVISDRLKELIKYKGYQVAPAELEALLVTHPAIQDSAVIGKPDVGAGELPRAYVVLKPNKTASEEEIQKFVAERLAPYKQLRGGVEIRKEIPKSASGKIMRRVLKDELLDKK